MSKTEVRILGIDPAMRNVGLAFAAYNLDTAEWRVENIGLIKTEKGADGKVVRKSSDDLTRGRKIAQELNQAIKLWQPSFAIAEVPTGAQDARASFSNGVCTGVLASLTLPLIEVSPTEVKMAAVGKKLATKNEMIEWAVAKWPLAGWTTRNFKGKRELLAENEHPADACATVAAGLRTAQFMQAMALMRAGMASRELAAA